MVNINDYIQEKLYIDKNYHIKQNDELYDLLTQYETQEKDMLYIEEISSDKEHGFFWSWNKFGKEVTAIKTNDDPNTPYTLYLYDMQNDKDSTVKLSLKELGNMTIKNLTKYLKSYLDIN